MTLNWPQKHRTKIHETQVAEMLVLPHSPSRSAGSVNKIWCRGQIWKHLELINHTQPDVISSSSIALSTSLPLDGLVPSLPNQASELELINTYNFSLPSSLKTDPKPFLGETNMSFLYGPLIRLAWWIKSRFLCENLLPQTFGFPVSGRKGNHHHLCWGTLITSSLQQSPNFL